MAGNALVAKKIVLTANYVPVTATTHVASGTLLVAADNTGVTYIRADDEVTNVPIPRGVPFSLVGVDLSKVLLKGTADDVVVIIGAASGR